jgi:hypothetical protein
MDLKENYIFMAFEERIDVHAELMMYALQP